MKRVTESCAGCKACINKCPKNAIYFKDEVALIDEKKCIDCGLCHKMCPSNNKSIDNTVKIKVARINDSDKIKQSSSGGIFGEIARDILTNDGVVYGAVYTKDYKGVKHVRCDSLEKLTPLLKSKYIRSDIKNSYIEIEKDLKKEKIVLFSGTPCQVAGLKAYLKKDYDNLYTIDFICHGTPSPTIWKSYAEFLEKKAKSKIVKVDFRYHNPEDPLKSFYVLYKNGKETKEILYNTSYGRAFLLGLINSEACNKCKYCDFHKQSDITLGDAWGYHNEEYPTNNSLVLINTKKGQSLYKSIKDSLIEFKDVNIRDLFDNNYPTLYPTMAHYNYGKVNKNAKDIDKELWYWLDEKNSIVKDKKGVGILNFHYENFNYGANLVAYSLSEVIKSIGYNPYIIDFDPFDELNAITRYETLNMLSFRKKYLNMTPRFKEKEELTELNKYLDMYVVGSDQVWRKAITNKNIYTYFLDFVHQKNKISYAASFGKDEFEGNVLDTLNCTGLLSSFYNISVRENVGKELLEREFNTTGTVVLDPTLLLDSNDYSKIDDDKYEEPFDVGVYFVMDSKNTILENKKLKELFPNKKIVNIKGEFKKMPFGKTFIYNSMSKWLDGFRKAKYIVTDSYHGLVFSIIFHKKVICIGKNSASLSRFTTLIENLKGDIDKVFYASLKDVKDIDKELDYKTIDSNLQKMKEISIEFLKNNLGPNKVKKEQAYYALVNQVLSEYIENGKKLEETQDELNSILYSRSWKITKIIRKIGRIVKKNGKKG